MKASSTAEPTTLLRAHQGLARGTDTARDTAKAICQCLEWDQDTDTDWVKPTDRETIHRKTLSSKAEAMEFSLIQPRVKDTMFSEAYLLAAAPTS